MINILLSHSVYGRFHSIILLLDYSGNLIWSNEEYPGSNIAYTDIDIKDKCHRHPQHYGLIVAYYGKLIWYRFDESAGDNIKTYNIETNKSNRAGSDSCV